MLHCIPPLPNPLPQEEREFEARAGAVTLEARSRFSGLPLPSWERAGRGGPWFVRVVMLALGRKRCVSSLSSIEFLLITPPSPRPSPTRGEGELPLQILDARRGQVSSHATAYAALNEVALRVDKRRYKIR